MTLALAWIRNARRPHELIIASDSRLRFGCAWDSCQKVFPLPRGDCALAFAGDTHFAYPFVHMAINAVSLHRGSRRRTVDISEAVPFLLRAINAGLGQIRDLAVGRDSFEEPDLRLIFGGYSWRRKEFLIWKFHFNPGEREFRQVQVGPWNGLGTGRTLLVFGNPEASPSAVRRAGRTGGGPVKATEDVQQIAKQRFLELLDGRGVREGHGLDMEPLEVLCGMVRDGLSPYVGGPPQVVKVYQHMNVQPFGIRWPGPQDPIAVLGRILSPGEKVHVPVLNPETLRVER